MDNDEFEEYFRFQYANTDRNTVTVTGTTSSLEEVMQLFVSFLRASGFPYVDGVTAHSKGGKEYYAD